MRMLTEVSANTFETVGIHVHELVRFEEFFDLRPMAGEKGVIFSSAQITESQMHNPRRRRFRDYTIRKIRILADDNQIILAGKFLYL